MVNCISGRANAFFRIMRNAFWAACTISHYAKSYFGLLNTISHFDLPSVDSEIIAHSVFDTSYANGKRNPPEGNIDHPTNR